MAAIVTGKQEGAGSTELAGFQILSKGRESHLLEGATFMVEAEDVQGTNHNPTWLNSIPTGMRMSTGQRSRSRWS